MQRLAIYFCPAPGALADAAAQWLGRDVATGAVLPQPHPMLPGLTVAPRRYGFHATLKAPFRLAAGHGEATLLEGVRVLARALRPVAIEGLAPRRLGGFLALMPGGDTKALDALAAQVVTGLDRFRAPLTEAEIARRNPSALAPRQRALLAQWGYPHVLDTFRFHMTLTDRLTEAQAAALLPLARAHFAPALADPVMLDALCILGEDAAGVFHLRHRVPLG